jgi:plasmid maintenance system killer protein
MEIDFDSSRLRKTCSSEGAMRKEWGEPMARKLKRRLADLEAAACLEDFRTLPGRCHELTADRKGQLAMDLVGPKRLIFRPAHNPVPIDQTGGLDWTEVTVVCIIEVVDYHD